MVGHDNTFQYKCSRNSDSQTLLLKRICRCFRMLNFHSREINLSKRNVSDLKVKSRRKFTTARNSSVLIHLKHFEIIYNFFAIRSIFITIQVTLTWSIRETWDQADKSNNADNFFFTSSGVYFTYFSTFFVNCIAVYLKRHSLKRLKINSVFSSLPKPDEEAVTYWPKR